MRNDDSLRCRLGFHDKRPLTLFGVNLHICVRCERVWSNTGGNA